MTAKNLRGRKGTIILFKKLIHIGRLNIDGTLLRRTLRVGIYNYKLENIETVRV